MKSLGTPFTADAGVSLKPFARCSSGKFRQIRESFTEAPVLRTWIKGFQNFDKLRAETPREFIAMTGLHKIDELNDLSGWIALQAKKAPADAVEWRARGDKLLDHVLRIMSFASSSLLRAPVQQFYFGNVVETTVRSQSKQTASSLRVFPHANQQGIFESAFTSFFSPPIAVEKLFFAIEWFAMDSSYNEVRLVNAMTALENLLDSNLLDADAFIEPKNDFKKTRKVLRRVISQCLTKWNSGSTKEINDLKEQLNEKLGDLNRRSLHRKLDILVERWKVPLKGISSPSIEAAKKARDRVVHRGAY